MPKKPTDTLQGFRIELQDSERELLQHFATSYRIRAITGDDGVLDDFSDMSKVLALLGVLGGLLELFGITDVFDFDNEIKASVMETGDSVKEKLIEKGFDREVNWQNVQEFARGFLRRPINRS
tara:strand:- start:227 stop:595 length:369 start_codon:yes stop_codon:yes gene_type:complete